MDSRRDALPPGVVPATPEAVRRMAGHIRREHRREIQDLSGTDAGAALMTSVEMSVEAYACLSRGNREPVFAMGVGEKGMLTGAATVWMLGTDAMRLSPRRLIRTARWGIGRAFAATGADQLEQFIPLWYRTGIAFALRLGFAARRIPFANGAAAWVTLARENFQRSNAKQRRKNDGFPYGT